MLRISHRLEYPFKKLVVMHALNYATHPVAHYSHSDVLTAGFHGDIDLWIVHDEMINQIVLMNMCDLDN